MKLVRDLIPAIIDAEGKENVCRIAEPHEVQPLVIAKLHEELAEVLVADTKQNLTEELADLLEVMLKYAELHDVTFVQVLEAKNKKEKIKGSFKNNVVWGYND